MAFEERKTIEELKIDTSRKFRVVKKDSRTGDSDSLFEIGDIVELIKDDNSDLPWFNKVGDNEDPEGYPISLYKLEYAEEEPKFKVGEKVKFNGKSGYCGNYQYGIISKIQPCSFYDYTVDCYLENGDKVDLGHQSREIEPFEPEKIAIHCKTQEEYNAVVKHYWSKGYEGCGHKKDNFIAGGGANNTICVEKRKRIGFAGKKYFEVEGYTIKPASYVLGKEFNGDGIKTEFKLPEFAYHKPLSSFKESGAVWRNKYFERIIKEFRSEYPGYPLSSFVGWDYGKTNKLINLFNNHKNMGIDTGLNKVVKFARNLKLKPREKLLRELKLHDENGKCTDSYDEIILDKMRADGEDHVVEIAEKMKAEQDKRNK